MSIESPVNIKCMEYPKIARIGSFGNFLIPALMKCYTRLSINLSPNRLHQAGGEQTSKQGSLKNILKICKSTQEKALAMDIYFGQISNWDWY